ncbi:hypothetical protein [Ornithinimicrobium panacihumi]|uniref:hypothetical protein n=1 Tax=Ornithinimicrobium panacihumi TaxID=2008449 RepID=UPI003F8C8C3D
MSTPVDLMLRDIGEAPLLFVLVLLPLILGAWAVRRGSRLGVVPIGTTVVAIGLWYSYYASDASPARGGAEGAVTMLVIAGCGLLVAVIALHRTRSRER